MAIKLTWDINAAFATGQRVYKSTTPFDMEALPSPLADIAPNVDTYTDEDVTDYQEYYYMVSAYSGGNEAFSDVLEITALSGAILNPTQIPNCVLWLDANSLVGNVTDGDPVQLWEDGSSSGFNFEQLTASNRPTFREAISLYSKPAIEFDDTGGAQWLEGNYSTLKKNPSSEDFTAFWVASDLASPYNGTVMAWREDNEIGYQLLHQPDCQPAIITEAGTFQHDFNRINQMNIVTAAIEGGVKLVQRIGGTFDREGDPTSAGAMPDPSYPVRVGSRGNNAGGPAYPLNGNVHEIVFYDRRLTDQELEYVEHYLVNKWIEKKNPGEISGLWHWFDADAITGLSQNDRVSQWDDLSPRADHATVGSGELGPIYTIGINNKPCLYFDNETTQNLTFASDFTSDTGAAHTIFCVMRSTSQTQNNLTSFYINGRAALGFRANGTQMSVGVSPASSINTFEVNYVDPVQGNSLVVTRDGTSQANLISKFLEVAETNTNIRWAEQTPGFIGSSVFEGEIYEFALFDRELTIDELNSLEAYAKDKYRFGNGIAPPIGGEPIASDQIRVSDVDSGEYIGIWRDFDAGGPVYPIYPVSSPNGLVWEAHTQFSATYFPSIDLEVANGRYWLLGASNTPSATSLDGPWTDSAALPVSSTNFSFTKVINNKVFKYGEELVSTDDGTSWTQHTMPPILDPDRTVQKMFYLVHDGSAYVAVVEEGEIIPTNNYSELDHRIWRSTDLTNWTEVTPAALQGTTNPWFGRLFYANSTFVLAVDLDQTETADSPRTVYYSSDGISWTESSFSEPLPNGYALTLFAYDGTKFILTHNPFAWESWGQPVMLTSSDAQTWNVAFKNPDTEFVPEGASNLTVGPNGIFAFDTNNGDYQIVRLDASYNWSIAQTSVTV